MKRVTRGGASRAQQRGEVEGLEARIDRHPVAVGEQAVEADRFAIDQHQLDLGVGHAERLDHVLHGGGAGAAGLERAPPVIGREEIVEFLVEAELGDDRRGVGGGGAVGEEVGRVFGQRVGQRVGQRSAQGATQGIGQGGR